MKGQKFRFCLLNGELCAGGNPAMDYHPIQEEYS